jgi:hypothetical protein
MKRVMLLVTVALMLAAAMALSGMVQAKPITNTNADKKCLVEAVRTVEQPGFNPSDYTFFGGTESGEAADLVSTAGPDVFCGFGGDDSIAVLSAGDIFLGGEGNDRVDTNRGTFNGGAGDDSVRENEGTFNGGPGIDTVGTGNPPVDGPSGT